MVAVAPRAHRAAVAARHRPGGASRALSVPGIAATREFAPVVGLACIAFNIISLMAGYFAPRALKLQEPQAIAIGFEIGIHNGTLAIFIALEVLGRSQATIAPAIYSLSMYLTAALFAAWLLHRRPKTA